MKKYQKSVLITGCSSGIGFQTALRFARNSYHTFASVRDKESKGATQLQEIALSENLHLEVIKIDVTDSESVREGVITMLKATGKIDVLVNNAGFGFLGPLEDFSIDEIKKQYETNIFGMVRMIKETIPHMRKQNKGTIITISSINGLIPFPLWSAYSSSKFAIESMSESLRFELAPFGIRVALVEPGSQLTGFQKGVQHPLLMKQRQSSYTAMTTHFFSQYNHAGEKLRTNFMSKFFDPSAVVTTIYQIAQQENPGLHHIVGIDAKLLNFFYVCLPPGIWNWILRKVYKW